MTQHTDHTRIVDLFAGERVFVVGLGKSGMATARALRAGGADVCCWDDGEAARDAASKDGYHLLDPSLEDTLKGAAALILSPGIPLTHPVPHPAVQAAAEHGVPVLGDIELLFRSEPNACFVGITGTNGKSTTTALIHHILSTAGMNVAVGGNLGIPALSLPKADIYVLEMSSYQLDLTPSAMFDVAVLLNITPDHLDRHGGMEGYIAAKEKILRPRTSNSLAIIGSDTEVTAKIARTHSGSGAKVVTVGKNSSPDQNLIASGTCPAIAGDHGVQNAAAARAVARQLDLQDAEISEAIKGFPGLAHRQERVATVDGVTFINDSKATNVDAAARALSAFNNVYWIAGGRGKDGGYNGLSAYLPRIRHAYLIGESAQTIADWIGDRIPVTRSETLGQAVTQAHQDAKNDPQAGPVLLSPACASFDQYPNFERRGDAFHDCVLALPARKRTLHSTREAA